MTLVVRGASAPGVRLHCVDSSPRASLSPADLVLPMFVKEVLSEPVAITSMPGVVQHTRDSPCVELPTRPSRPGSVV